MELVVVKVVWRRRKRRRRIMMMVMKGFSMVCRRFKTGQEAVQKGDAWKKASSALS